MVGCLRMRPKIPFLEETYRYDDKNPFGGYIAYQKVKNDFGSVLPLFSGISELENQQKSVDSLNGSSLYIIITDRLSMSRADVEKAFRFIEQGNDLFISANAIDDRILERAGIRTNQMMAGLDTYRGNMVDTRVNIYFGEGLPQISFKFFYYPFNNYFRNFDTSGTRIQGTNDQNKPNFAVLFFGKGKLFLHLAPRALGNYFLLSNHNIDYLSHIFNYFHTQPDVVYWDEFYKRLDSALTGDSAKPEFSSLGVIMSNPFLKWAFLIGLGGFLFYILSGIKRQQRVTPLAPENGNASIDFVETVARLYYVNKDNKNISSKLITYFYEFVRSRYYIYGNADKESFIKRLAGKRGMNPEVVRELIDKIEQVRHQEHVSDEQLTELNKLFENFYNHR